MIMSIDQSIVSIEKSIIQAMQRSALTFVKCFKHLSIYNTREKEKPSEGSIFSSDQAHLQQTFVFFFVDTVSNGRTAFQSSSIE